MPPIPPPPIPHHLFYVLVSICEFDSLVVNDSLLPAPKPDKFEVSGQPETEVSCLRVDFN